MTIRESSAMPGYPCSAPRQLSLFALLLTSIIILIATVTEAQDYRGPKIYTYGEPCYTGGSLPYQVQASVPTPHLPRLPDDRLYRYDIRGPAEQPRPANVGFKLPVSIQKPLERPNDPQTQDPFRGRSYGIGIQPVSGPQQPSLGRFSFGVQNPVPGPQYVPPQDPSNRLRIQVQPGAEPASGPSLWGPLPIGIERPIDPPTHGPANPPKLTGLTSQIDRVLIPACDLMGGPASSPYAGSSSNIHGPFVPSYGLSLYPPGIPSGSISSGSCR